MKFGISAYVWTAPFRDKDLGLIAEVADMGYEVLEIHVWHKDQFDVARVAETARREHVECVVGTAMSLEADLAHPDASARAAGLNHLKYCIDVAEQLGARIVCGPICVAPFRHWWPDEERRKQDFDYAVAGLREAAAYAGDKGIRLALEILNRHETPFCTRAADGIALCEAVDHPAFGLLLDTFHMNIEEKHLGEPIDLVGEHLYYLHACENDRGTPGSGHVPWEEVATALRRINYDGYVVIESFVFEPEFAQAAKVWHPCAPDMNALATEGLAFLKSLLD